jgi:hypothetical protein
VGRPKIPVRSLNELPRLRHLTASLAEAAAKMDSSGSAEGLVSALGASQRPDALAPVDSRIVGSGCAIIDLGERDWPVLFHGQRGRAHIGYLEAGLDPAARCLIGGLRSSFA